MRLFFVFCVSSFLPFNYFLVYFEKDFLRTGRQSYSNLVTGTLYRVFPLEGAI